MVGDIMVGGGTMVKVGTLDIMVGVGTMVGVFGTNIIKHTYPKYIYI